MPVYGGGKALLGRDIAHVVRTLEERAQWDDRPYAEPFCGLLGVAVHMAERRDVLASDLNADVVLLLEAVRDGWEPPTTPCTKAEYDALRHASESSAERGFFGLACAYSGIFFAGYRLRSEAARGRDYFGAFRRSLLDMRPRLQRVRLRHADYHELTPHGMTVYCDPPYRANALQTCNPNATIRSSFAGFDSDAFWHVVRAWSHDNLVVVSEYEAPDDFACVWTRTVRSSTNGAPERHVRRERLFVWRHAPWSAAAIGAPTATSDGRSQPVS
jgi:DNA adenine methylase